MESSIFQQLGISVLLGLLVGLQREHAASGIAGMRTFPLITVLGTLSALLADYLGAWIVPAAMLGVVAVIMAGHLPQLRQTEPHTGTTTDVAMLVMFAVGAYLAVGPMVVAVAVGGGVAVLLQFKGELHGIAKKLGDEDLRAIMQFVLISCIILPVLPDQNFGPSHFLGFAKHELDVFNPFETWLMVVLIVGMSLGGYIVYKFFGGNAGILLGGVLGGAISSTATTVSYAQQAKDNFIDRRAAAIVIMIASTVSYVRVLIAVLVVSPDFLPKVSSPVGIMMGLTFLPAVIIWLCNRKHPKPMPEQKNPTQMKSALVFGAMYVGVLFALAAAKQFIGGGGLYLVAGLSGLTEMDAITLSTARMSLADQTIMTTVGWRLIVVAAMANMVSKSMLAGLLGGRDLFRQILILFAAALAGGAAMLIFM
ncbi:MAG: MgtC/SapB family protein [Thermoguttaceae bacterium]|jgi:uncharacterized membrane protein (DUF4010 family)